MGWHFNPPRPEEYDTDEDYQEALKIYEWAEADYEDAYHERMMEERENN